VRLCVDLLRDRGHAAGRETYTRRMEGRPPTPEDLALGEERRAEIRSRLDRLPARQRQAVELRAQGLSVHAVADAMGVSYKVVEGLLGRAREALRSLISRPAATYRPRRTYEGRLRTFWLLVGSRDALMDIAGSPGRTSRGASLSFPRDEVVRSPRRFHSRPPGGFGGWGQDAGETWTARGFTSHNR
jgi:hypothetical protein